MTKKNKVKKKQIIIKNKDKHHAQNFLHPDLWKLCLSLNCVPAPDLTSEELCPYIDMMKSLDKN